MSDAYKATKGKLKFKGDSKGPAVKKPKAGPDAICPSAPSSSSGPPLQEVVIRQGTGRITSSGSTIQGHATSFMAELAVGDALLVTHPTTLQDETKIVRMVLSNTSIGISSAFSTDLISTSAFRFIKAPKDEVGEEELARQQTSKAHKAEQAAFGTYASEGGTRFNYRVKKGGAFGGYHIVSESTAEALTREDLLDKRTKKKSDRFCY